MKILLLAPNAGVSLSTGGGSNFVLKQARAYAKLGHEVVLAGYHALPLDRLETVHGVSLAGVRSRARVVSAGGDRAFRLQRNLPGKPSPYLALFDPRVRRWLRRLGERIAPGMVWFHDDLPAPAVAWARGLRSDLYVHYPLRGRSVRVAPPLGATRDRAEAAQDALLRAAGRTLVHRHPQEVVSSIATNSEVTGRVCRSVWGASSTVWSTYVTLPATDERPRGRSAISIGALHRGKGLPTIVEAFDAAAIDGAELTILGHARDPRLLAELRAAAGRIRTGRVVIVPDAPRDRLEATLGAARVVVGGAAFEPFGLALLEGMAHGASPIVRSSDYSGAWTDLVRAGTFGTGFDGVVALRDAFRSALGAERTPPDARARDRAGSFSEAAFDRTAAETLR